MSRASSRAARGLRERGRGRAGWVRRTPGRGARGPWGAGGGGGGRRSWGVFCAAGGRAGEGPVGPPAWGPRSHPVCLTKTPSFRRLGAPPESRRVLFVAGLLPALCCAALAPHVLFGWVSNGGRGGSAAGRGLQGGQTSGPGQLLGANMGSISPAQT